MFEKNSYLIGHKHTAAQKRKTFFFSMILIIVYNT